MIKTTSYSQTEILRSILTLYVPGGQIDCDPTYGRGQFYADGAVPRPRFRFDIHPLSPDVKQADCRKLPIASNSIRCMVFDPPFLATSGPSLFSGKGNIINRRFSVYPNETSLHQFYVDSLKEASRVLVSHGILIFKCQDKVSSGKQYFSHVFIMNEAAKIGLAPRDLFVLLAKSRLTAQWQIRHQRSARKFHCYILVLEKDGIQPKYV